VSIFAAKGGINGKKKIIGNATRFGHLNQPLQNKLNHKGYNTNNRNPYQAFRDGPPQNNEKDIYKRKVV